MLSIARVVNTHPESHAVDVVFMDDGRRISGVQVLSGSAGTNFGCSDLAVPDATGYEAENSKTRDIYAVVSWVRDIPVVLGFLFPQVAQCLFADKERMVYRHASDVYVTIDKDGNTEVAHPSGAFLRIGTTPGHEDLTGKDYDNVWKIARNTDKQVHIHIEQAGGVAKLDIDPAGNVLLDHDGNLTTTTGGNLSAQVGGTTTVNSTGVMDLTAPTITLNGNVVLNGPLTQGKGANGGNCVMQGPLLIVQNVESEADVKAGAISLKNHKHGGVTPGGAQTSTPV